MRIYRVYIADGDVSTEAMVHAENEFMAARYTILLPNEIIYRIEKF